MFPAVASIAGLDISRIEIRQFSPQLRDTMLVTKQVDAVTGFDSTVLFNLKANGVAIEDATVIYYADNGLDVYGNAFLANPASCRRGRTQSKPLCGLPRAAGAMPSPTRRRR